MFLILAALAALAAEVATKASPKELEGPIWIDTPTGEDIARYYPANAQRTNVEGVATMACQVAADGRLTNCAVTRQYPAGAGFGDATLKLAPLFRMTPVTKDGAPVEGGTIRIPIRYRLPYSRLIGYPEVETVAACYGQLANRAEGNAEDLQAWRGAMYWFGRMLSVAATLYDSPSRVEAAMTQAREAAAAGTLKPKSGYDLASCLSKIPK
ncbi:energy transducer TonB [Phenylobacterium sp.]|uniref:energy transducer TonB n=1 Tax=Phenylobacterium sp. TaxID=1871053 RepID=UPI002725C53E|nr:energy transducer TonB [Phenylobacterium sp.]MDO8381325.1 energy transducer TonB [Phenylobacterium sp.]